MEHDVRALVKKGAKEEENEWSEEDDHCWSDELAELEDGGGLGQQYLSLHSFLDLSSQIWEKA